MIGHPASTDVQFRGKEPALYFLNKPTRPAGGANPPPPHEKKKEEKKEKELSFFYTFQKLKKRHDTGFYYIHSEITADPCDRGLENTARTRRPTAAFSRPTLTVFHIRTDP